jgi:hypothetical protein
VGLHLTLVWLSVGDGLPIGRVAAKILNKETPTADKGCYLGWGFMGVTAYRCKVTECDEMSQRVSGGSALL